MPRHLKVLAVIFLLAAGLRLYGLNWDQNAHLHPDERFLTMVANAMSWPNTTWQYLDTATSQLNPHNVGWGFYVYGTFPVILVKFIAELLGKGDYNQLTLVGRAMSTIVDLGTLLLVYLIAKRLFKNQVVSVLSAFGYATSVLSIQLSHFFAVDPYLTFFLTLSFYLLLKNSPFLGVAFGLAIASKISAVIFSPVIALGFILSRPKIFFLLLFTITIYIAVRLAQPYLFADTQLFSLTLNPKVIANWKELKYFSQPGIFYPPGVQWTHIIKGWFPFENMILWGLGIPLGIAAVLGLFYLPKIIFFWILLLYGYESLQYAQTVRYFHPIYPYLAISAGLFLSKLNQKLLPIACCLLLIWPAAFVSIYSRPVSRVSASEWIFKNIPAGSKLSCEHWDDCLPLGGSPSYQFVEFPLYNPDTPQKWSLMSQHLASVDYIILSSNRLYGSIMTVPEKYPTTNQFYKSLFDGSLGFTPIAQFTSRPNIPIPGLKLCLTPPNDAYGYLARSIQDCPLSGISFVDDYADENFTVFDHPKVIIFKKP